MKTPYSPRNQRFSNEAHAAARTLFYPLMFEVRPSAIKWKDHSVSDGGESAVMDGQLGIDRTAKVSHPGLAGPLEHVIQERFRKIEWARKRDITITAMNNASGQPSELYKLKSGLFVYGYFDDCRREFGEVIAVYVEAILDIIGRGLIETGNEYNPRSDQNFVTLKFDDLWANGAVRYHKRAEQTSVTAVSRSRPHWSGASHKVGQVQSRFSFSE